MTSKRETTVNELPNEILQEIFLHFASTDVAFPIVLALTCRRWSSVAYGTRQLWKRIYFGDIQAARGLPYVLCGNLRSLAKALHRVGVRVGVGVGAGNGLAHDERESEESNVSDASNGRSISNVRNSAASTFTFDLTIGPCTVIPAAAEVEIFKKLVGDAWLYQCRSLTWLKISALGGLDKFLETFREPCYSNLESLAIYMIASPIAPELNAILGAVEESSMKLQTVIIDGFSESGDWSPYALESCFPLILNRVRTAKFNNIVPPFHKMVSLEDLTVYGDRRTIFTREIRHINPSLRHLTLTGKLWLENPPQNSTSDGRVGLSGIDKGLNITNLTVDDGEDLLPPPRQVTLVSLQSLTIYGGTSRISSVDAPNLQELRLCVGKESGTSYFDAETTKLNRCTLRPTILHMDLFTGTPGIQALIKVLGAELQELYLTLLKPQQSLGSKLTAVLIGPGHGCPHLRKLNLICPRQQYEAQKTATLANLRVIADDPRGLKSIRYAVYHVPTILSAEFSARDQWILEWHDIL